MQLVVLSAVRNVSTKISKNLIFRAIVAGDE